MREIKFRAWDKKENVMIDEYAEFQENGNINFAYVSLPKDLIVMQFTGLLDKNGKEIYEGDFVEFENDIGNGSFRDKGVVEYEPEYASFQLISGDLTNRKSSTVLWAFHKYMKSEAVVLGNFYENSELLNK